ncbi:MAG: FHA domain-containing protein [Kofleriaceae bacterium]
MASLKHLHTGEDVPLAARHIVGRSRTCQLQLDLANVSAVHAELTWDGRVWSLRDLGSRNGSFVDERRLAAGEQVALEAGQIIGFGVREGHYRLADVDAPRLIAFGPDGSRVADGEILCLPSMVHCEAMIFQEPDRRWVIERPDGTSPVGDEECVVIAGQPFFIHLPNSAPVTRELDGELAVDEGILEFRVSRDGEHVDLYFRHGENLRTLETRAHVFLLLALARTRLGDAARAFLPETEHGWMHREDIMRELAITDIQLLNLWVYRARQQLAQLEVRSAARVIERREGAKQLRLGLQRVQIIDV